MGMITDVGGGGGAGATGTLIMMLIQSIVRLNQRIASTSISTSTFLGSVFTATAERAG